MLEESDPAMLCLILIAGGLLIMMGQHDRSEALFAVGFRFPRLDPTIVGYGNLATNDINVNRLKEARQTLQEAQQKNFDGFFIRVNLYSLAFLRLPAAPQASPKSTAAS